MLLAIGAFKLIKAMLLFALAFGLHRMLRNDAGEELKHWAHAVRIDPDSHYIHLLISKITGLDPRKLHELSIGTFCYGAVFLVEGTGLVLRKRWAEFLTIISTTGLLPLEVYEVVHHPHLRNLLLLVINVLIVAYLIVRLIRTRPLRPINAGSPQARQQTLDP